MDSPNPHPERPSFGDMAVLVGMQLGIGLLVAGIVSLLPLQGSQGWVGAVGTLTGAIAFTVWKEKRVPGFVAGKVHRLAIAAAVLQIQIAAAFGLLLVVSDPELRTTLERELSPGTIVLLIAGVLVVGGVLVYACTRFGLRMGLKSLEANKPKSSG
jgi:hypothetical protein